MAKSANLQKSFAISLLGFVLCFILGCNSVKIPDYIHDEDPYKKVLYAPFQDVLSITTSTLDEFGWKVTSKVDPAVYERSKAEHKTDREQVLLFTQARKTGMVVASNFHRINMYLRELEDSATEVELRYMTVTTTAVKEFVSFNKDSSITKILDTIELRVNQSP